MQAPTSNLAQAARLQEALKEVAEADVDVLTLLAALDPAVQAALLTLQQQVKGLPKTTKSNKRARTKATGAKKSAAAEEARKFETEFRDWYGDCRENATHWQHAEGEAKVVLVHGGLNIEVIDHLDDCNGIEWAVSELDRQELNVGVVASINLYLRCALWRRIRVRGEGRGETLRHIANNPRVNSGGCSVSSLYDYSTLGHLFEVYPALMLAGTNQTNLLKFQNTSRRTPASAVTGHGYPTLSRAR